MAPNRKQRRLLKKNPKQQEALSWLHETIETFISSTENILGELPESTLEGQIEEKYLYAAGQCDAQVKFMPELYRIYVRDRYFEEMFIQSFYGVKEKNKDKSILEVIDMLFDHYRYSRKAKNLPYIRLKGPGTSGRKE